MENTILSCYRVPALQKDLASQFTSVRRGWTANCSLTRTYPEPPWVLKTIVRQDGSLFVNGKHHENIDASPPTEFLTYPFTKNMIGKKKKIIQYVLNLTDTNIKPMGITIHANPKTKMLFVKIDGDFHDGIGLLCNPLAGNRLLGRDSVADMSEELDKYGEEWQVRDTEQKLFREHRAP